MRIHPLVLAIAVLLAPAAALKAQADLPVKDTILANGLHVIVVENHSVPLVTVELDVRNGAFTQTPEYEGLAHLYEHMFFKANKTIPSQEKYLQRLRQLGASWNGTTSDERVNYFFTVGVDSTRAALQFMEDAVRYPLFLADELVRERPVVIGEFDRNEASPFFHMFRGTDTLLWTPGYYSRKNTIGNRKIILSTTPEKMQAIQALYYVPNNTALIIAGDIKPADGFRLGAEVFGDWPRSADPFATKVPDPPPLTKTQSVIIEKPVNGVTLSLSWRGPSVAHDTAATYAADVLSAILLKPTSAFQKRLVESGLAVNASIAYYTLSHVGPINVYVQTVPEKLLEAERATLEEIAKLSDSTYISQKELEDAQKEIGINALYEREQVSQLAHTIGFWWCSASLDYYRNYVPNMQKVTRADIARYARTYLEGKPFIAGALISPADRKKIGLTAAMLIPQDGTMKKQRHWIPAVAGMTVRKWTPAIARMTVRKWTPAIAGITLALALSACDTGTTNTNTSTSTSNAVEQFTASGITVIHKAITANDVVTAVLCIKGGAAALNPRNAGIEHLYLEAMTHGTAKYDKDAFAALATSTGTAISGQVNKNFSAATMRGVRQNLDDAWDLFAQAVMHPMFPESEVRLVRRQIAFTLRQRTDDPDTHLELLRDSVFYQGHPYALDEAGTPETINQLSATDLAEWQKTRLTKGNLLLVVVGNVTRADIEKRVAATFGTLPAGPQTAADVPKLKVEAPSVTVVSERLPTNYVLGTYAGPGRASSDYPAFALASRILSERLFEEVRTKRNLTYSVGATATAGFLGSGSLYVTAVEPDTTLKVILSEVRRMQQEEVPLEFVQEVLNTFATAYWMAQETNMGQAMVLADWELTGGGWKNALTYPDRLKAVTAADIQRVATEYMKNARFVVIGDPAKVDRKLFMSL